MIECVISISKIFEFVEIIAISRAEIVFHQKDYYSADSIMLDLNRTDKGTCIMLIELQMAKKAHNLQAIKTRVIHTLAVVSVNSCSFRETNKKDKENESRFVKKNLFAGIVCCSEILHRSGKFYAHDRMIRMTSHDDIHRKYSCIHLSSHKSQIFDFFLM